MLLKPENQYPFLRVILAENGTHFLGLFSQNTDLFSIFFIFWHGEYLQKF